MLIRVIRGKKKNYQDPANKADLKIIRIILICSKRKFELIRAIRGEKTFTQI